MVLYQLEQGQQIVQSTERTVESYHQARSNGMGTYWWGTQIGGATESVAEGAVGGAAAAGATRAISGVARAGFSLPRVRIEIAGVGSNFGNLRIAIRSPAAQAAFRRSLDRAGLLGLGQKAHPIVEWGSPHASASRRLLANAGIDIDDLDNGVGLTGHSGSHGRVYSEAVYNRLKRHQGDAAALRQELLQIRAEQMALDRLGTIRQVPQEWARREGTQP